MSSDTLKGRGPGGTLLTMFITQSRREGAVVVRHLAPQDIEAAMALVSVTFSELFAPDMYVAIQQAWPAGQLVEVDAAGRLVGLLLAIKRSAFSGRILVMAVRGDARGRGTGSQLLRLFLRQCLVEGVQEVVLEVRVSNLRAQSFYGRSGFVHVGTLPRYYRDGEDGYVMARRMA